MDRCSDIDGTSVSNKCQACHWDVLENKLSTSSAREQRQFETSLVNFNQV